MSASPAVRIMPTLAEMQTAKAKLPMREFPPWFKL
jgi:hypothetical protein